MAERLFRAADPASLRLLPLDAFTVVFHRPSGLTHLLAAPAPEILELLADAPLGRDALLTALAEQFALDDASGAALDARLDELVAAGLVMQQ